MKKKSRTKYYKDMEQQLRHDVSLIKERNRKLKKAVYILAFIFIILLLILMMQNLF